jgi:hypothetical protein
MAPHDHDGPPAGEGSEVPQLRLRLIPWDLICTGAMLTGLAVVATTTNWLTRLFGFLADVCTGEDCPPAPLGIDLYIYPVVWGGIGAAIAAAVVGPVVSLLKGWYLFFWPILALAILLLAAVAGSVLTGFSQHYWH